MNQINIEEKSTLYEISTECHSDLLCENIPLTMEGIAESDNRITIRPTNGKDSLLVSHSDPDLVIGLANMMLAFAQMVKKENQKSIDTNANA